MDDRDDLLHRLEENLEKARAWREQASAEFDAAIQALPAGHPDRGKRLQDASKEYSHALEAVTRALKEYNDFLNFGKKPPSATPAPKNEPDEKAS